MQNVTLYRHKTKPGTDKAFKFVRRDNNEPIFVPIKALHHVSQKTIPDKFGMCQVIVTVDDWFVEKNDL
jgi:hypothetical protein